MGTLKTNIPKYYAFQILNSLQFFGPIIVIFYLSNGLHLTQVLLLQSIYAVTAVVTEVPTGVFADIYGKKTSIATGALLLSLATFFYALRKTFWWFAVCEIMAGSGLAFISGADRAFIHETLQSLKRKDYKIIEGNARGLSKISMAIGNILGGVIGSLSLAATFVATSIPCFASFLVCLAFYSPKASALSKREGYFTMVKESWQILKSNKKLLWLTIFFAIYNGVLWSIAFLLQPYLTLVGIPIVFFGFIFAMFSILAAIGSGLTRQYEKLTNGRGFVVMSFIAGASLLLLGAFASRSVLILWGFFDIFSTMNFTLVSEKVLALVPSNKAATLLSFQNLARRLFYGLTGPLVGLISDTHGILFMLRLMGIVLLGVTILLAIFPLETEKN